MNIDPATADPGAPAPTGLSGDMIHPTRDKIGGSPYEENCAALGVTDNFAQHNRAECTAYIDALRRLHGREPEGVMFCIIPNRHDFGTYREAGVRYNHASTPAREYAEKVTAGLATWEQVGMWAPVIYDRQANPLHTIANNALCKAKNPKAHPTVEAAIACGEWFPDADWTKLPPA